MHKRKDHNNMDIWNIAVTAGSMGMTLFVSMCVGIFCGYWIDTHAGTTPWGLIIGGFFGAATGFWGLYKKALRYMNEDSHRHHS